MTVFNKQAMKGILRGLLFLLFVWVAVYALSIHHMVHLRTSRF